MSDVNSDAGLRDVGGHDSFPHPVGRLVDHRALLGDAEGVQGQQHAGVVDLGLLAGRLHHPGDLRDAAAENVCVFVSLFPLFSLVFTGSSLSVPHSDDLVIFKYQI